MKKAMICAICMIFAVCNVYAADWTTVSGKITTNDGTPLCALVLANGQFQFTCDPVGEYSLYVPLDSEGEITIFGFCDGMMPYSATLDGGGRFDLELSGVSGSSTKTCSGAYDCLMLLPGEWYFISEGGSQYMIFQI
ncbi:hypothetical protein QUF80_15110 [Desulfococcaceae bacterium HSG8]|nr:hypothetical protein [Desulfococcaceae bacterium HSG8]